MLKQKLRSFDGRELNVFHTPPSAQKRDIVVVLPFGVRYGMADRVYAALADRFNIVTWESRFVLDHQADAADARIETAMHVLDLGQVIHFSRSNHGPDGDPQAVNVVGYCSGAGIALLGAARYPQSIRRLVLVSGEYVLPSALCEQGGFQREVDAILPAAAADRASAQFLFESISSGRSVQQSEFHNFISLPFSSGEHLYRYGLNYVAYRNIDFIQAAREVAQPALVMFARGDQQVTPESAEILSRHLPHAVGTLGVDGDHYEFCRGNSAMIDRLTDFLSAP